MSDWRNEAACLGSDPELFFPEPGGDYVMARRICAGCPVAADCLSFALSLGDCDESGIYGGVGARHRRKLRAGVAA
jgi:WhiB family redox-sensing transcriptional regulator